MTKANGRGEGRRFGGKKESSRQGEKRSSDEAKREVRGESTSGQRQRCTPGASRIHELRVPTPIHVRRKSTLTQHAGPLDVSRLAQTPQPLTHTFVRAACQTDVPPRTNTYVPPTNALPWLLLLDDIPCPLRPTPHRRHSTLRTGRMCLRHTYHCHIAR